MKLDINDIYAGIYGFIVGDALGVPVEFIKREELDKDAVCDMREYGTYNMPKGTWSDDTSMTLATMDAFNNKALNLKLIMDNFVKWYTEARYTPDNVVFDIGNTTRYSIENYILNKDLSVCGMN